MPQDMQPIEGKTKFYLLTKLRMKIGEKSAILKMTFRGNESV